jgi:hypothetical protein
MTRTYETHILFKHPFVINGYKDILPAGSYRLEVEEERIGTLSFMAYKRKQVTLHLKANPKRPGRSEMLTLPPHEVDAALAWDRRCDPGADHDRPRSRLIAPSVSRTTIERGENEGMLWIRDIKAKPGSSGPHSQMFLDDEFD